jgi:CHAD domain-containing protein
MALDQDKIEKVLRALSQLLKHRFRLSSPDRVRGLRTASRRLEAAVHALTLKRQRPGNQLLKVVAPILEKAGKVRNVDVFSEFASALAVDGEEEYLNQLLEYLRTKRWKAAGKLSDAIARQRETVDRRLRAIFLSRSR